MKVHLTAADFEGGIIAPFQGIEHYFDGINKSERRSCIGLSSTIQSSFSLSSIKSQGEYIIRIKGMWDFYSHLGKEMGKSIGIMDTIAQFAVHINNKTVFDSDITFLEYRKMAILAINLKLPYQLLHVTQGLNIIPLENKTAFIFLEKMGSL